MQYNQLKPFMKGLLKDELNDNCINEIVTFTVGQVMRFEIETNECGDRDDVIIDDTKRIGSKRCMTVTTTSSCKRQRMK